jgi:hypothetical protein
MSRRKVKMMDEGQVDRRRLILLVEMGILRELIKRLVGNRTQVIKVK